MFGVRLQDIVRVVHRPESMNVVAAAAAAAANPTMTIVLPWYRIKEEASIPETQLLTTKTSFPCSIRFHPSNLDLLLLISWSWWFCINKPKMNEWMGDFISRFREVIRSSVQIRGSFWTHQGPRQIMKKWNFFSDFSEFCHQSKSLVYRAVGSELS